MKRWILIPTSQRMPEDVRPGAPHSGWWRCCHQPPQRGRLSLINVLNDNGQYIDSVRIRVVHSFLGINILYAVCSHLSFYMSIPVQISYNFYTVQYFGLCGDQTRICILLDKIITNTVQDSNKIHMYKQNPYTAPIAMCNCLRCSNRHMEFLKIIL